MWTCIGPLKAMKKLLVIAALLLPGVTQGQDEGKVYNDKQSKARPFGLDVVDLVQRRGSDEPAREFLTEELPDLTEFIKANFEERQQLGGREAKAVDPENLRLITDTEVRTYFVTEGAGYHNTLGFNVDAKGLTGGDPKLIFPDASSKTEFYDPTSNAKRSTKYPVLPGDFVDLGSYSAGQQLDFFLIANGANGGRTTYGSDASENPDGIQHTIAFSYAVEDSPYLVIGFEDLFGGGDEDFNDLMFVVDIGVDNVGKLVSAPEPGTCFAVGVAGFAVWRRRRKKAEPEAV